MAIKKYVLNNRIQNSLDNIDEAWHVVDASNEPTFENDWFNSNSTTDMDCRFKKDLKGQVLIDAGLVEAGTSPTATIFTLPTKYRPERRTYHTCVYKRSADIIPASLVINIDGTVDIEIDTGYSLTTGDLVSFQVEFALS